MPNPSVIVIVITVERNAPEQYANATLKSMLDKDPTARTSRIVASVGGGSDDYLAKDTVEIAHIDPGLIAPYSNSHGVYKLTANLLNAGRIGVDSGADLVIVTEDDLQMATNWLQRTQALGELASKLYPDWFMTACSSYASPAFMAVPGTSRMGDRLCMFRLPQQYWGTQFMVYPRSTAKRMIANLQNCLDSWRETRDKHPQHLMYAEDFPLIGDHAVKKLYFDAKIQMLVSLTSMAKHVGRFNSWGNSEISEAWRLPTERYQD